MAITTLVMPGRCLGEVFQRGATAQHTLGPVGVQADTLVIGGAQGPSPVPHRTGDDCASEVVQQRGNPQRRALWLGHSGRGRRSVGDRRDVR
jgi:hypothetical protein